MANKDKVLARIIQSEGGYQNNPSDTGNFCGGVNAGTKYGISATGYKGFYGVCPSPSQMQNLTLTQAKQIWEKNFWDKIDGDKVPLDSLAELYIYSIGGGNSGWLHIRQAANSVSRKPLFEESKTSLTKSDMAKVNALNGQEMFKKLSSIREQFFQSHPNTTFVSGWLKRLDDIKNQFYSFDATKAVKNNWIGITLFVILVGSYLLYKNKKNLTT